MLTAIATTPPAAPPTLAAPLRFAASVVALRLSGGSGGSTVAVAVEMKPSHAATVAAGYANVPVVDTAPT